MSKVKAMFIKQRYILVKSLNLILPSVRILLRNNFD